MIRRGQVHRIRDSDRATFGDEYELVVSDQVLLNYQQPLGGRATAYVVPLTELALENIAAVPVAEAGGLVALCSQLFLVQLDVLESEPAFLVQDPETWTRIHYGLAASLGFSSPRLLNDLAEHGALGY